MLLTDKLTEALDLGECRIGVFLDFSKALDTTDHAILLTKLRIYGIQNVEQQWFIDFSVDCIVWHTLIIYHGGENNIWCSPGFCIRSYIVSVTYQWPS